MNHYNKINAVDTNKLDTGPYFVCQGNRLFLCESNRQFLCVSSSIDLDIWEDGLWRLLLVCGRLLRETNSAGDVALVVLLSIAPVELGHAVRPAEGCGRQGETQVTPAGGPET